MRGWARALFSPAKHPGPRDLIHGSPGRHNAAAAGTFTFPLTSIRRELIFNRMVKYKDLDAVFAALADPTRRAILESLRNGPASVTELAGPFRISLPAVSKHLAVLAAAGLIEAERDGRIRRMHLRTEPLKEAAAWLDRYEHFWNRRLDALERMLAARKPHR